MFTYYFLVKTSAEGTFLARLACRSSVTSDASVFEAINISIFDVQGKDMDIDNGNFGSIKSTKGSYISSENGVYTARPCGVFVECKLPAGSWLIILSCYSAVAVGYSFDMYSSQSLLELRKIK